MVRQIVLAAALVVAGSGAAFAQEQTDIVVVGERLEQASRDFAVSIAAPSARERQLARWDQSVCVGTTGIGAEQARLVVDHVSTRAAQVGLRTGEPNCRATIMIIFASDANAIARTIVDQRRDLLGYYGNDAISTGGREGLEAFASTPRPVRWWQVARNVGADGTVLDNPNTLPGDAGADSAAGLAAAAAGGQPTGGGSFAGVQSVRSSGSRLRRETRQDLNYILVIVDAPSIAGFPTSAVLDYVSMVSLAQIDPDAAPSAVPSILSLFSSPVDATPEGMTAWDEAYLQGLYRATREAISTQAQIREIGRTMATELRDEPQP